MLVSPSPLALRVARFLPCTEAEGPFRRFALWVQGCTLGCPGCCNPGMFDPAGGTRVAVADLKRALEGAARRLSIEGLTVVGGEPTEQANALAPLAAHAQELGLGVVVYTGRTWEAARRAPGMTSLLRHVDTLVTGPFDRAHPETRRAFVGSANQRLVHRTARYDDPTLWLGPRGAELRLSPTGDLLAVGMPSSVARALGTLRRAAPRPTSSSPAQSNEPHAPRRA